MFGLNSSNAILLLSVSLLNCHVQNAFGAPTNMLDTGSLTNLASAGDLSSLGDLGSAGDLSSLGNLGSAGDLSSLGNLGSMSNLGSMGDLGSMADLGSISNLGSSNEVSSLVSSSESMLSLPTSRLAKRSPDPQHFREPSFKRKMQRRMEPMTHHH